LNTLIFIDGWSGALQSTLLYAKDYNFVVQFIMSVYVAQSWCATYSCSNAYVKRTPGGFLRFQKHQMR